MEARPRYREYPPLELEGKGLRGYSAWAILLWPTEKFRKAVDDVLKNHPSSWVWM